MKHYNLTANYLTSTVNNATTVALVGLKESNRLEKEYPTREFVSDIARARAIFEAMSLSARAGGFQVWYSQGPLFETVSMNSVGHHLGGQNKIRVTLTLGRVVVTHALPSGHSKRTVGLKALLSALEAIVRCDKNVTDLDVQVSDDAIEAVESFDSTE